MKRSTITATLMLTTALFCTAPPAQAALTTALYSDWGSVTATPDTISSDPAEQSNPAPNLDIVSTRYASDASSYYFRMDLASSPLAANAAYAFILTSPTGGFGTSTNPGGQMAKYIYWDGTTFTSDGIRTHNDISSYLDGGKQVLEWQISKTDFSTPFTYYAATYTHPQKGPEDKFAALTLQDRTGDITATPIPGAALLLGSGLLGLVGIRRRSKQAAC